MPSSYKDLHVWQKSIQLVVAIYELTDLFPRSELLGLTSQMRRAAVSIPSNIAEGSRRSKKEFKNFTQIAYGSGSELETQIIIAKLLPYAKDINFDKADNLINDILSMLNKLTKYLNNDKR